MPAACSLMSMSIWLCQRRPAWCQVFTSMPDNWPPLHVPKDNRNTSLWLLQGIIYAIEPPKKTVTALFFLFESNDCHPPACECLTLHKRQCWFGHQNNTWTTQDFFCHLVYCIIHENILLPTPHCRAERHSTRIVGSQDPLCVAGDMAQGVNTSTLSEYYIPITMRLLREMSRC